MAESEGPEFHIPGVLAVVTAYVGRYERALVSNGIATLNMLFRASPLTVCYGAAKNPYAHEQISAFRVARSPSIFHQFSKAAPSVTGRVAE